MNQGPRTLPLVHGACWAVAAALAGREGGLLAACLVIAAALAITLCAHRAGPWVWALPAGFAGAAAAAETPICWPDGPGPVQIAGHVLAPVTLDPITRQCIFRVADEDDGQVFLCVVTDTTASDRASATASDRASDTAATFRVLPGDRVAGPARLPDQVERRRAGRLPKVLTSHDALRIDTGPPGIARFATACRLTMQQQLMRLIPGEPGLLLCHLTLGRGPELRRDLVQGHRDTGLSHLLAVSGAHLTMLAWMLGVFFYVTTKRPPLDSRWFRRGCTLVLFFYGLVTGMEPPVFRAVVATFVFFAGAAHGRRVPITAVLALPALLTALLVPKDLFSVSFNLSYAAVIGLALSGGLSGRTRGERWIRGPLLCSTWASLCTMPLTLWYFGRFAPWTILITPVLSPVVAAMLGLSLLVNAVALPLPALASLLSYPLSGLAQFYCFAVRAIAELPLAPVYAGPRPELALLAACGLVGMCALLYWPNRRGVAVLCACLSLPHFVPTTVSPTPGLRLLAVGHGLATLIESDRGTRTLVDCGCLGNPRRAASVVAAALLPHRQLDQLILTHGDFDHVGGVIPLLARVWVTRALLPVEMRGGEIAVALAEEGCTVEYLRPCGRRLLDDGRLLVHRPMTAPKINVDRNDQSMWVHVDGGTFTAVLSGDALELGVQAWLRSDLARRADVLALPHHGRPNEETLRLLEFVKPDVSLVSSAAKDGLSAQGAVAEAVGYRVLHTGSAGTIHVRGTSPPEITTEFSLRLRSRTRTTLRRN